MVVSTAVRDKLYLISTIAVIALSTLSYFLFQAPSDPQRCNVLLNDGFWLKPENLINWQPSGCMMHTYKPTEAISCLAGRRVAFFGGASTRNLFDSVITKVDPETINTNAGQQANSFAEVKGVKFEFIWDPILDSAELKEVRTGYEDERTRPALAVIGFGHDYLRREKDLTRWGAHVGALVSQFGRDSAGAAKQADKVLLLPVLAPNVPQLSNADRDAIKPADVDDMNDALSEMADKYNVPLARAFNKVIDVPGSLSDGLTPVAKVGSVLADIVLNLRCNEQLPKHYYFASTCCNSYPRPSWVQLMFFVFVCALVPLAWYMHRNGATGATNSFLRMMPGPKYHIPILVMGLTVVLSYYCDRTNVFGKEQKQTEASQFFVLMGLCIAASLFTLKKADKDLAFLNREQTDEWKGWMQVAILIYHYVGVSKTEYIYNYMRVCPTSYLFMTGFGHTVYFLKKDDYSFKRVVATMLRLNLLNVILAYVMGNDWLLYYFAPLVTWNFFVIFFMLYAGHQYNKNMSFLFGKMFVFSLANTAFNKIPGVLEGVWGLLQMTLRMQGDLREWRFRVTLDQYSVLPGMIAAVLFINWDKYQLPKSAAWPSIHKLICLVSVVIMLGYAVFESTQPSKILYNQKHTYVSWLPCCAFVVLRNATPWLRKTHNGFFAWVGRGSLETFLLQFHIWLAADTAGLLVLGPANNRLINAIISTPIFFYVASETTLATGAVIEWIMGAEPKPARPQLPTIKSHPQNPNANHPHSNAHSAEKTQYGNGNADGNGSASKSLPEAKGESSESRGLLALAAKDLRVRVGLMLGFMAFMNWTYYL